MNRFDVYLIKKIGGLTPSDSVSVCDLLVEFFSY